MDSSSNLWRNEIMNSIYTRIRVKYSADPSIQL